MRLGPISFIAASFLATAAGAATAPARPSRLLALAGGKAVTANTISLSEDVGCDPARSYSLWATEAGVKSFFAPDARIGTELGGDYTIIFFPADDPGGLVHGTKGARILARDPGRFLAFEWVVFAGNREKGRNAPPYAEERLRRPDPLPTWVELSFEPRGAGTHVEFRHFGFRDGALWTQSRTWFTRAWSGVLARMKRLCAAPAA
jgi:hypothetical protein